MHHFKIVASETELHVSFSSPGAIGKGELCLQVKFKACMGIYGAKHLLKMEVLVGVFLFSFKQ